MPASPASALTFRALVTDALRAIRAQLGLHVGLLLVLVLVGSMSCVCVSAAGAIAFVDSEPTDSDPPVAFLVMIWTYLGGFTWAATAFARGFTVAAVHAQLRSLPLGFGAASRASLARSAAQLGIELARSVAEYLPLIGLTVGLARVLRATADPSTLTGLGAGEARSLGWLIYPVLGLGYFVWSSPIRSLVGPWSAVAQAEPGSLVAALRRSRAIVSERPGAFLRARLAFGAVAIALLAVSLAPWFVVAFGRSPVAASSDMSTLATLVTLGSFLLFWALAYSFFVLDAAIDTAFYVRATPPATRSSDVADVFA